MNKQLSQVLTIGVLSLGFFSTTISVQADHRQQLTNSYSDYAKVVDVDPGSRVRIQVNVTPLNDLSAEDRSH